MSKSQGASSVIPGPMPSKSASLRVVSNPDPPRAPSAFYDDSDSDERTIVSAISRDMLGLTDDGGAATKTYEVPRELLELARARAKSRASDRPPLSFEDFSLAATTAPTERPRDPGVEAIGSVPTPSALPPEIEVSDAGGSLPDDVEIAHAPKPSRKFAVTKWLVLVGVYLAICYFARIWLPVP